MTTENVAKIFYKCKCFYTRNIYSKILNSHIVYEDDIQFYHDYKQALEKLDEAKKRELIQEIQNEVSRRKSLGKSHIERTRLIKENYRPLMLSLYSLSEQFFKKEFLGLISSVYSATSKKDVFPKLNVISEEKELYSFPVFTEKFCNDFMLELENFEQTELPKGRPNSMNHYGVLLDELGFNERFIDVFREKYLNPLAKLLFSDWCGDSLDSHRAFTVAYDMKKDEDLDMHFDNAEVTLNVCLGKSFTAGELYFGDMRNVPVSGPTYVRIPHIVGHGIFHRGQHVHGALPITSGERRNMIIWMRSSSVRNKQCPMCDSKPELIPCVDYGDGFTNNLVNPGSGGSLLSLCSVI